MKLTDQVRQAIDDSGQTRYRIAQETGIDESALAKFYNGHRGLSMEAIDTLAERYLNAGKALHLVHLSEECHKLLTKAGSLVEVNVIEDPKYFVADNVLG